MPIQCTCAYCGAAYAVNEYCGAACYPAHRRAMAALAVADRFWAKVDKSGPTPPLRPELGPCWLWTASRNKFGYGKFYLDGRQRVAHVAAFILSTGHEPPRATPIVLHECDGGAIGCVRPSHLAVGTQATNMAAKLARGREPRGERRAHAKLTADLVRSIRARYAAGGISQHRLAIEYGVNQSIVCEIVQRKRWTHVG